MREFLRTALYLGRQRIARLKADDINEEAESIRQQDNKGRSGIARDHLLPLTARVTAILEDVPRLAPRTDERGEGTPQPGWIFTTNGPMHLCPETVSTSVTKYASWCRNARAQFPGRSYNLGNVRDRAGARLAESAWTYTAIEGIFDAVRAANGLAAERYDIYGHSAGSQFVHRLVVFRPDAHYCVAIAANSGWYMMPDLGGASDKDASKNACALRSDPFHLQSAGFRQSVGRASLSPVVGGRFGLGCRENRT